MSCLKATLCTVVHVVRPHWLYQYYLKSKLEGRRLASSSQIQVSSYFEEHLTCIAAIELGVAADTPSD
jgi:hypothetical protein